MNVTELVVASLRGMGGNLTRSILTVLMVVIGVGSVITLVAVGNGTTKQVNDQISSLGATAIELNPGFNPEIGRPAPLTEEDATALRTSSLGSAITLVAPSVSGTAKIVAGERSASVSLVGTTPDYFTISNARAAEGRPFTASDVFGNADIVVIDTTLQNQLFPDGSSPVGRTVLMAGNPVRVIGVLTPTAIDKKMAGMGQSGTAYTPIERARASVTGYGPLTSVLMSATSTTTVDEAKSQASAILSAAGKPDVQFYSSDQLRETLGGAQESLNGMLASIASISLLVGGIGVTNVMLLTVRERTREIGIRKAIGAPRRSIAGQFIIESTTLSVLGGGLGVVLALVVTRFPINNVMPVIDLPSIGLAAGLSVGIGVVFGTYPAVRAAGMKPVDALRVGT